MAFRNYGFDSVQRVLDIKHEVEPIKEVPELVKVNASWPKEPHTIWYLSDPIKLGHKIETGPGMRNAHVTCDFDLLLTCNSVAEIRQQMKLRK